jgi:hypothetical protein
MKINYCNIGYRTESFDGLSTGCAGLVLFATTQGEEIQVGKITFWDSSGQFFIELCGNEIPLEVAEKFICEAKQTVPIE